MVVSIYDDRKIVFALDSKNGPARPFIITQVKRYLEPSDLSRAFFTDFHPAFNAFSSPEEAKFATEIICDHDPRAESREMIEARRKEIKRLIERGCFKALLQQELRDG